jgi:uncharacterized damage-inducible protein DinB
MNLLGALVDKLDDLATALLATPDDVYRARIEPGRELAFVINHTIHHQALIAVLLAWHGIEVAPRFGVAPSTPKASW